MIGFLESVTQNHLSGWVINNFGQDFGEVKVYIQGEFIGQFRAKLKRPDLELSGINGQGFLIEIPEKYKSGITPFDVFCRNASTGDPLRNKAAAKYSNRGLGPFGGLWIDSQSFTNIDSTSLIQDVDDLGYARLINFAHNGYLTIDKAISPDLIDNLNRDIESYWDQHTGALIEVFDSNGKPSIVPARRELRDHPHKLLDIYRHLKSARDIIAQPAITSFLSLVFQDTPLAFQGLSFWRGSQQALHRDSAYVKVVNNPRAICAVWIALEDIQAGSGELVFVPGSHRNPEFVFESGKWMMQDTGAHPDFLRSIANLAANNQNSFLGKKGDILFWHADLAHGGSYIANPQLTRKSLVIHFCPASLAPFYEKYSRFNRIGRHSDRIYFQSEYSEVTL